MTTGFRVRLFMCAAARPKSDSLHSSGLSLSGHVTYDRHEHVTYVVCMYVT
jgi:hypothetical protein